MGAARDKAAFTRWPISWRLESGRADYVGAFALTAGDGAAELAARFEAQHDDYSAILVKALADRLAEAFAERLHQIARRDWGFGREESLSRDELIEEKYRGIRPAPGYPACPDHTEKGTLFTLLDGRSPQAFASPKPSPWIPPPRSVGCIFLIPRPAISPSIV